MIMTDRIYNLIVQFKQDNDGNSPSVRDLLTASDLRTTSAVQYQLVKLEREGRITFGGKRSRSIRVTGGRWIHDSHLPQTDPDSSASAARLRRVAGREAISRFLRSMAKHLARANASRRLRQPPLPQSDRIADIESRLLQLQMRCIILEYEMQRPAEPKPMPQADIDQILREAGF
jgi:hypothetical protein